MMPDLDPTPMLRRTLPRARLTFQVVPLCSQMRLLLLELDSVQTLSHEEAAAVMESPPYWTLCWASGQVLARWLLDRPDLVRGRRVLDFGTGSGVVAIAAAMAGCLEVVAVDCDPQARAAVETNARCNGVTVETCPALPAARSDDLLLLADVLYDRDNVPTVEQICHRYRHVIIAESRLKPLPLENFSKLYEADATTVPDVDEYRDFGRVSIYGMGVRGSTSTSAQRSISGRASA